MSSEIYYDRAFIKVGDKYIPLVNQGSSNCFDFGLNGQLIPEKHWNVLNFFCRNKILFTEKEIDELADRMEKINTEDRGVCKKSRYRDFEIGEFGKWIRAGMKNAYSVEDYDSFGNHLRIINLSQQPHDYRWVSTTEQLLDALGAFKDAR